MKKQDKIIKAGDIGYAVVKAAVGTIPFAGAAASELLSLLVAPPLEQRRTKFLIDVGEKLLELEKSSKVILEKLQTNDQFVDTTITATTLALKTSEEEKITAFKNAILNTALDHGPDKTLSQIFLNLLDTFTVWHIRILELFDDPKDWFSQRKQPLHRSMTSGLKTVALNAYPALKGQDALVNLIWGDLERAGLHNSGTMSAMMTGEGVYDGRTTEMGRKFLHYIRLK